MEPIQPTGPAMPSAPAMKLPTKEPAMPSKAVRMMPPPWAGRACYDKALLARLR
jgi:hypothetical protein